MNDIYLCPVARGAVNGRLHARLDLRRVRLERYHCGVAPRDAALSLDLAPLSVPVRLSRASLFPRLRALSVT